MAASYCREVDVHLTPPPAGQPGPRAKSRAQHLVPHCAGRACRFDLSRYALLLLGGDKAGNWQRWYRDNIPLAEQLYLDYTAENEE